nr:uncharacterized protein LOC128702935 [Cherax quadricarinatus]
MTKVSIKNTRTLAPLKHQNTSAPQKHQTLAPLKNTRTQASHKGSSTQALHKGSSIQAPHRGTPTQVPHKETSIQALQKGTPTQAPHKGTSAQAPHKGMSTQAPHKGTSTQAPRKGTSAQAPHKGTSAQVPHKGTATQALTSDHTPQHDTGWSPELSNKTMIPQREGQLVQCYCGPQEVLMGGRCQPFPKAILVDIEASIFEKSVTELNVIVQDLYCSVEDDHREMRFTEGQFYLRTRGDIVLSDTAGYLSGLRINNYCVSHSLDEKGNLASILKACVPPPSIPRSITPSPPLLLPPLSAGLFKNSVQWPVIRNHYNPLNCTEDPMKTLLLGSEVSHLVALPTGVIHTWVLSEDTAERKYTYPPEFCVDGRENLDGSLTYTANLCYSNPQEHHHKICDGNICVRKCCNSGQILDVSYRCIRYNITFTPAINISITQPYKTVIGMALCSSATNVTTYSGRDGTSYLPGRILPPNRLLYMLLQGSRTSQNGGWYQLWHVLSLMHSHSCNVTQVILREADDLTCIILALTMQLGYLAAFFWLSVLCFEVWRKVRPSLEHKQRRRNYISDFKQQFSLLVLMSTCWFTEILSWKIPPPQMWTVTDIMNTLQGFFIFVIFLANASKRKQLKKKYPGLFVAANHLKVAFQKLKSYVLCRHGGGVVLSHVRAITSQVGRKISDSSTVSNISTLTSSVNISSDSSSRVVSSDDPNRKLSSLIESEEDIVTLSHSALCFTLSSESDTSL